MRICVSEERVFPIGRAAGSFVDMAEIDIVGAKAVQYVNQRAGVMTSDKQE